MYPLSRAARPLTVVVEPDPITAEAIRPFDLSLDAPVEFYPWLVPDGLPDWSLGFIVGASGSGKSKLLESFGTENPLEWHPGRSVASHFLSADEAVDRFYAVGLSSVPVWRLPYHVLSTGQKFRADLARRIGHGAVIDEFTSVVDRHVAVAASRALSVWVRRSGTRRMVLASCHRDVIDWLQPDWVIDTDAGQWYVGSGESRGHWWADFLMSDGMVGRLAFD